MHRTRGRVLALLALAAGAGAGLIAVQSALNAPASGVEGARATLVSRTVSFGPARVAVHVLPSGFVRIRHYGFLANRGRAAKLGLCRTLLAGPGGNATPLPAEPVHDWKTRYEMLTGRSLDVCPACGEGHMVEIHIIEPAQRTPRPQWMDSS